MRGRKYCLETVAYAWLLLQFAEYTNLFEVRQSFYRRFAYSGCDLSAFC